MESGKEYLPGEFWGVVAHFNPTGSRWPLINFTRFSRRVRPQGLRLLVVELAFENSAFEIDGSLADCVIQLRSATVLWQKERLLNIGVENLPPSCDKIAWLDGDLFFERREWVNEASHLLQSKVLVQPYDMACWLPRGASTLPLDLPVGLCEGHCLPGMASTLAKHRDRQVLADYMKHGHTGFAWAMRRSVIDRHGLYDRSIVGGADFEMAHCFFGDEDFLGGRSWYCRYLTKPARDSISVWGRAIQEEIGDSIGHVPGRVLHLYHGDISGRNYLNRLMILREAGYDPAVDVAVEEAGPLRWNSDKPELHRRVRDYFFGRAQPDSIS